VSHCDTCHVTSQSHPLNEHTRDARVQAKVAWRGGHARASLGSRELRHNVTNLWLTFDDALHPENRNPLFDNRLQYDSAEGPQAVDLWPDIDKDTSRLDLHLDNLAGFVVNAGGVWSETENRYTGLTSDYTGYMVNAARRFGSKTRLTWRGRAYSISSDDVFVDTNERVTQAGPHGGQTYEDVYGVNYDWWRRSALDRDALESKLDLSHRLSRKAGTLKLQWEFKSIDRDHYQVLPGEYETTRSIYGLSWRARPGKGLKVNASYRHASIDNPFMLVNGACSTLVSPGVGVPWDPTTPQYDDQHQAQIAETTASPSSWDELKAGLSYSFGKTTLSGSYRFWDGDNRDGDLTDWERSNQSATLTVWSAPTQDWEMYVAYAWQDSELESPMCIPIMDG
jgi:hypothetical protein